MRGCTARARARTRTRAAALLPALALTLSWGPEAMPGWHEQRYRGRTEYVPQVTLADTTMRAAARAANSALLHRVDRDPRGVTLMWRWRVFAHPGGADPRVREGDDRAAGVLVLVRRGWFPWSWRALLYQWTPAAPAGTWGRSPYGRNVKTLVLRDDPADSTWRAERRDLEADLAHAFGEVPATIEAIGIICDTDDTRGFAASEFGPIRWLATAGPTIPVAAPDTAGGAAAQPR